MKNILKAVLLVIGTAICIVIGQIFYLNSLKPKEEYPDDTFLQNEQNKTALIIVAHDDDAGTFCGTTSLLAANGWNVNFLCFYTPFHRPEDNPIRKLEMQRVAEIQGLVGLDLIDFAIAKEEVNQGWMPIPYKEFPMRYKIDSLSLLIDESISKFGPSVIFTLDNTIGWYGHPEHVLVGQLVEQICRSRRDSIDFPVKRIYQMVYPPTMAKKTMDKKGIYQSGKEIYQCVGMPEPDIQIDISSFAITKKKVFLAHASQHRNIKKFFPYYRIIPGWIYWRIFRYEYFNILNIK